MRMSLTDKKSHITVLIESPVYEGEDNPMEKRYVLYLQEKTLILSRIEMLALRSLIKNFSSGD